MGDRGPNVVETNAQRLGCPVDPSTSASDWKCTDLGLMSGMGVPEVDMEPSSSARRTRALAMVVGLLMLPACQGSAGPADTTGSDNVVLHLASIDAVNVDGHSFGPQTFVDSLASVSAGRLTAQVAEGYGDGSAEVETTMVKDIAAGRLDRGWHTWSQGG